MKDMFLDIFCDGQDYHKVFLKLTEKLRLEHKNSVNEKRTKILSYYNGVLDAKGLRKLGWVFSDTSYRNSIDSTFANIDFETNKKQKRQEKIQKKKMEQEKQVISFFQDDNITRISPDQQIIQKTKVLSFFLFFFGIFCYLNFF